MPVCPTAPCRPSSSAAAPRRCCRRATSSTMLAAVATPGRSMTGAEVTTEANPDSVDAAYLRDAQDGGFTRVSFGMQSAVPHVLATLERTHDPARIPLVVDWAARRGARRQPRPHLRHARARPSTTGERSLDAALAQRARSPVGVLAHRRGRHEARPADPARRGRSARRRHGRRHVRARRRAPRRRRATSGTRSATGRAATTHSSRHNLSYWRGHDWWGVGPGAHSHVGGSPLVERQAPCRLRRAGAARASRPRPVARPSTTRPVRSSASC